MKKGIAKRGAAALVCVLLTVLFAGCGKKQAAKERALYNSVDLSEYVELSDYKKLSVDTSSEDFKSEYDGVLAADVEQRGLYVRKTEGAVASGDTANIDYVGKKDGIAFQGGTAAGYDLEIGSGSFIPGFEDGLIGVQIGSTVDLNLTFPEEYQSAELAGQAVVFTVTVNYVKTETPLEPEEYYAQLGFSSVEDYYADARKRAVRSILLDALVSGAKVSGYPQTDYDSLVDNGVAQYETMCQSQFGIPLETYLQYSGQTMEAFRADIGENSIKPMMDAQLPAYALLDNEGITVSQEDIDAQIDAMLEQYGSSVTKETLLEYFGDYYFEALAANEKAADYLYENAQIK